AHTWRRLDQAGVAGGGFCLIGRPLQALLPQPVEVPTLLLTVGGSLQRQREGCGRECGKDPLTDKGIDGLSREILAIVPSIGGGQAVTGVAMHLAWPSVAHLHATAACAAHQYAR